ncbi:MAG: tetratricopeptide repeat protein [Verrucomicrobiota bacterium]
MPAKPTCPRCGTQLSCDELEGLCPTCVGQAAFGAAAEETQLEPTRLKAEEAGERIGNYKLLEKIGEGGFGVVWVADQERPVRRRVALKIIKLGMDTKEVIARFGQERQALAMMDHPHIAKVLDAGSTEWGRPYFVMELVRGIKITDYCDQANLSTADRLALFIQVCQAVQHAHQKGIIHRDLKPSNILVTLHDGMPVPKVIDFGVAKATQQQRLADLTIYTQFEQMIGTPLYMSPEQAEMSGLDIDTRSDIYSLGVLLYELLTGRTPFDPEELMKVGYDEMRRVIREQEPRTPSTFLQTMADATRATVAQHRQSDPAKLTNLVRGDLDWIVMKALEKDRTRRYETANGLAMDIQRHLANEPVLARPPSSAYRFQKLVRRNKLAVLATGVVLAVLVAATGISVWQATLARKAAADALEARNEATAKAAAERTAREASEATRDFLTELFQSPDPSRNGRTITVAETLDHAAQTLDTSFTNQPARRARLQQILGMTYHSLGLAREAIPLLEKARDYYLTTYGPEYESTLSAIGNLAISYNQTGRHEEALKLGVDALALYRKVSGPKHPSTLITMMNLAASYGRSGRHHEALKLSSETLALQRQVNGPEHPVTIIAMGNLAQAYHDTGRHDEAHKLRSEALALQRQVNGPEHPNTLIAMGGMASCYYHSGRSDEALKLREEVLPLHRKVHGPEHPATLQAMLSLAHSYDTSNRRDEALTLQEEALPAFRKVLGPEHPETLRLMRTLDAARRDAGRRNEELKMGEEELEVLQKANGPEHPDTLLRMRKLVIAYSNAGRRDDALKMGEGELELRLKVNGPEHTETLGAMTNLATFYRDLGRLTEAVNLQERSLAIKRRVLPTDHPYLGTAFRTMADLYAKVADSYLAKGDPVQAVEALSDLVERAKNMEDPPGWNTAAAIGQLAKCHVRKGDYPAAEVLAREAFAILTKTLGPKDRLTIVARDELAQALSLQGKLPETISFLAEASVLQPEDTVFSLRVSALQMWFGKDAEHRTTCQRLIEQAEQKPADVGTERAVKALCLSASPDPALLARALSLARHAADLVANKQQRGWYQLTLGMAEYRSGNDEAAERAMLSSEESAELSSNGNSFYRACIEGTARLFRAMIRFRQGKPADAQKLFTETEAQMIPLPGAAHEVLVNVFNHDDLVFWLAYKEAKALLQPPAGTAPPIPAGK